MSRWPNKYIIGLTGNIATGKSVVRKMLEYLGAYGIDADALAHRAMAKGAPGYPAVVRAFGTCVLDKDEQIDRKRLSNIVFSDPDAMQSLEAIVHPLVDHAIDILVQRSKQNVVVIEAVKLLETNLAQECDTIWAVSAPGELQIDRLMHKRHLSDASARYRIAAQSSQDLKVQAADYVIENNGSFEETWDQVQLAWSELSKPAEPLLPPPAPAKPGEIVVRRGRPVMRIHPKEPLTTQNNHLTVSTFWGRLRIRARTNWRNFKTGWLEFRQSPLAVLGLIMIFIFALMAIAHPILMKTVWPSGIYDPETGFDMKYMHPITPNKDHLLGTDVLGRDVLSMLLAATTPTFILGLTAALATAVIGTIVGGISAYYGGVVDFILSRISDVFILLPAPILMVIVGSRFRDINPAPLGLIYGVVAGLGVTSLVMRTYALKVKVLPFIQASRLAGGGSLYTVFKHIMPHLLPLAALQMLIAVTGAVVADGFISFLGLTRSISNWGTIIYSALTYGDIVRASTIQWHVMVPPSLALSFFALAFYLVSRGLHRVADPRLRT